MAEPPAAYGVEIAEAARAELVAIADHSRRRSPQNARLVHDRILDAINGLDHFPDRFRLHVKAGRIGPVHAMLVDPFLVCYRADDAGRKVTVLRVLDGRRRQPRRF